jgi:uncharacterized protein YcfJ
MRFTKPIVVLLIGSLLIAPLAGCETTSASGNKKTAGAVIGGLGGALAGALIGKKNRAVGGLIGAAAGAAGGYLIGSKMDKDKDKNKTTADARKAAQKAQTQPATPADVKDATTADLNNDGFVTLDEVVAMKDAGLGDKEMIKRLQRTQQYFQLSDDQVNYLRDRGVDEKVVTAMRDMRPDEARTASETTAATPEPPAAAATAPAASADLRTDRR